MKLVAVTILASFLSHSVIAYSARILGIYPIGARSHFVFGNAVMKSLHSAGHHITFVNSFPSRRKIKNFTEVDSSQEYQQSFSGYSLVEREKLFRFTVWNELLEWDLKDCIHSVNMDFIQGILKSKKKEFDVVFINASVLTPGCLIAVAEILDLPVIGLVTNKAWRNAEWSLGSPHNPAVMPLEFSTMSNTETFISRLSNFWNTFIDDLHEYFVIQPAMKNFYRQYSPTISEKMMRKPSLIFTNGHPILRPRPLAPNVIEIGGIHVNEQENTLPENLKTFIDEAPHGVILLSFGSMLDVNLLPEDVIDVFRRVFARIPQRVLWKSKNSIENISANVLTSNWFPQTAILAHRNVVGFITHCGISGIYEAVHFAKPLVMVPVHYDQVANAKLLEDLGVGPRINIQDLTDVILLEGLNSVVNGTSFKRRMEEISRLVKDRSMTPQDMVIYWTEYVIRHNGARHLQIVAADMPLYQYLLLDVILFVFVTVLMVVLVTYNAIRKCWSLCVGKMKRSDINLKKVN